MEKCEFYDRGLCRLGDTRVPPDIGYSDIPCSDSCNNKCYYRQLQQLKEENKILRESQENLNIIREMAHDYKDKAEKYKQALRVVRLNLDMKNKSMDSYTDRVKYALNITEEAIGKI